MSLVNYESSSEEDEEEKPHEETETSANEGNLNLSNLLPKPKETSTPSPLIETTSSKGSIKISVPKLPDSDSDDEYSSNVKKPSFSTNNDPDKPRLGLFAKLPAPSNTIGGGKQSNRTLIPHVFSKKKKQSDAPQLEKKSVIESTDSPITGTKTGLSIKEIRERSARAAAKFLSKSAVLRPEDNVDSDEDDNVDFFSYVEKAPHSDSLNKPALKVLPSPEDVLNPHSSAMTNEPDNPVNISPDIAMNSTNQLPVPDAESLSEGIIKLRGKKRRNEEINFIDIRADDALVGNKELLLKSISEEKMINRESHSKKKNVGAPTSLQKRKHQLTYLVHEAKKRELELKNTWAQNRATKMQTQAKYGF